METFYKWFAVMFVIFFGVGLHQGCNSRDRPKDEQLVRDILAYSSYTEESGSAYVDYVCGGRTTWRYALEQNTLEMMDLQARAETTPASLAAAQVTVFSAAAASFGFSLKEIFFSQRVAESKQWRRLVGVIVGTVSGYGLGFWLGSRSPPPCDAPELFHAASDQSFWRGIEREVWIKLAYRRWFWAGNGQLAPTWDIGVLGHVAESISARDSDAADNLRNIRKDIRTTVFNVRMGADLGDFEFHLLARTSSIVESIYSRYPADFSLLAKDGKERIPILFIHTKIMDL